jgi:hypothetical protein
MSDTARVVARLVAAAMVAHLRDARATLGAKDAA